MEVADENHQKRLKHNAKNCQSAAKHLPSETSSAVDDAIAEGEDLAAELAVELLLEEQRLSKKPR